MDLQLRGQTVLVTGGSSGIGREVVRVLLEEGANVSTCARHLDRLREAWSGLDTETASHLELSACDVRVQEDFQLFVSRSVDAFGGIDGLVANAGQGMASAWRETTNVLVQTEIEMKVLSILNPIREAEPWLKRSTAPRIVIMGSVTANLPDPQMLAVGAARAAVSNISRTLAAEFAEEGINVNTINLGAIGTLRQRDKYAASGSTVNFEEWSDQEAALRRIPMGRFGRPSEVAPLVAMLVSPLATYITGTSIDVAGGIGCSL